MRDEEIDSWYRDIRKHKLQEKYGKKMKRIKIYK